MMPSNPLGAKRGTFEERLDAIARTDRNTQRVDVVVHAELEQKSVERVGCYVVDFTVSTRTAEGNDVLTYRVASGESEAGERVRKAFRLRGCGRQAVLNGVEERDVDTRPIGRHEYEASVVEAGVCLRGDADDAIWRFQMPPVVMLEQGEQERHVFRIDRPTIRCCVPDFSASVKN